METCTSKSSSALGAIRRSSLRHMPKAGIREGPKGGECCHRPPARAPLCPATPGTYSSGLVQNQLLDGADDGGGGRGHGRRKLGLPPHGTRPRPRVRQPPDCPKRPTEKTIQTPDTRSSQKNTTWALNIQKTGYSSGLSGSLLPTSRQVPPRARRGRGWRLYRREVV